MPNKLLESARVALEGKDFAALKVALEKAPVVSNAQKNDIVEVLEFAQEFSRKKGRSTVEATLPIALQTIQRVFVKCKSNSAEALTFVRLKCSWVATACMIIGITNSQVKENVKELVKVVNSNSDEAKFAPYLNGLCRCISVCPDALKLCEALKDKLVALVKRAIKQPDSVQPCAIDAVRIILGFIDQGILGIDKATYLFKCLWNPYSYVYAPLRQLHINNSVVMNNVDTLMGILQEIVEKHSESSKLFDYDSKTMCAELPTVSDNTSTSTKPKQSGGKGKKAKAPMMSLAQMQKLKREKEKQKQKAKGTTKVTKQGSSAMTSKANKSVASSKPTTIRRLGKVDHPLISSLIAYLLEPAVCEKVRRTVTTLCAANERF